MTQWSNFGKTAWGVVKLALIGVAWAVGRHYSGYIASFAVYDPEKILSAVDLIAGGMAAASAVDLPVGIAHKFIRGRGK